MAEQQPVEEIVVVTMQDGYTITAAEAWEHRPGAVPALHGITLPGLIDRAARTIAAARDDAAILEVVKASADLIDAAETMAEVMAARQIGQLAAHHAKLTKAANETHADCLRIMVRAESRMAQEVDRAQAAGEVAGAGQPRKDIIRSADNTSAAPEPSGGLHRPASLTEIGVSPQRLQEWRKNAAKPEAVEAAIQAAIDEDRAPTRADINRAVTGARGTYGTGENEWYTPAKYIDAARDVLGGIDLDPASSELPQGYVRAERFHTMVDDGLKHEWHGRVWLNPPYAQPYITDFVQKMVCERSAGRVKAAIMLTHNYTDTSWFHEAASVADAICYTRGRVAFTDPEGKTAAPTQGQAFFYFGDDTERFIERFAKFGFIVEPVKVKARRAIDGGADV